MAGIYIHVPFCKTRCAYCDFYTGTNEARMDELADALRREAQLRTQEVDEPVKTIYFGGGTPSRLKARHFDKIFDTLRRIFSIEPAAEITVEANPDDLSDAYVRMLAALPVNRLSIGIQSFNDGELNFLKRRHSAREAIEAVRRCQRNGFDNISIDLMYGLPGQTLETWDSNLRQALSLEVPHISSYHLIYEDKTPMYRLLKTGRIRAVDEEDSRAMFALLIDRLTAKGYIHYEISAFGKKGFLSRHNSSYWLNEKYLGLGPAAHSFDGLRRSFNIPSLTRYLNGVKSGQLARETENLDANERYNEAVMTGLRTMWGLSMEDIRARFGEGLQRYCLQNARKYLDAGLLVMDGDRLRMTREGIFISNGIMSDLMKVD